jgi:outer membrane protein OmpA-like peptidoglycan-associated protein
MAAPGGEKQNFETLRALLLGDSFARLDSVEAQARRVDAYVGDKSRLEAATADILVEAFRKAEVARHKELASAVAPLVVAAIQSEIRNSKDMMVEALYPITGRLVTAAVANAFRDLVESLNQRIDAMVSADVWRLRLRALATGRSLAEVALAEADSASVKRALLLERGSGRVLASWPRQTQCDDHDELTSGLIAAITEFAATVYADRGGELRMLDLGSSHVFLRASARVIVAAEFAGKLSGARERRLDEAFLKIVEAHEKDEQAPGAAALGDELGEALKDGPAKPASKTPLIVVGCVVAALALWAAYGPAKRALRDYRISKAYAEALKAHPGLGNFPLRLEIDHEYERVVLRGLSADEIEPQALLDAIAPAALPYRVERAVKTVATTWSIREESESTQARLAQLRSELEQSTASLDRLRAELGAAPLRLRRLIDHFAVFFTEQENLVDPAAANAGLDELARLLKGGGEELRVVGYADEVGTAASNRAVSRRRAEKVVAMLVERGVARDKLAIVARSTLVPIAETGVGAARSRRVAFERAYDGEFGIR